MTRELRAAGGLLKATVGADFDTPGGAAPNCLFLSYWGQHERTVKVALTGSLHGIYLLMMGTTLPPM